MQPANPFPLRVGSSGAPLVPDSIGAVPVYQGNALWSFGPGGGYSAAIGSRAELIAAVGEPTAGVFAIPSGRYIQTASFSLNTGERIEHAPGAVVDWTVAPSAVLSGEPDSGPLWTVPAGSSLRSVGQPLLCVAAGQPAMSVAGNAELISPSLLTSEAGANGLVNTGATRVRGGSIASAQNIGLLATAGLTRIEQCNVQGANAGLSVLNSSTAVRAIASAIESAGVGVLASDGQAILGQCQLLGSGAAPALSTSGNANVRALGTRVQNNATGAAAQLASGSSELAGCEVIGGTASSAISVLGGRTRLIGGTVRGEAPTLNGVSVDDATESLLVSGTHIRHSAAGAGAKAVAVAADLDVLQLLGVIAQDWDGAGLSGMAIYTAGTVRSAAIINCAAINCSIGVRWTTIPTDGLLVIGCALSGSPFVGFTPADARVNAKANSQAGALSIETAIVT